MIEIDTVHIGDLVCPLNEDGSFVSKTPSTTPVKLKSIPNKMRIVPQDYQNEHHSYYAENCMGIMTKYTKKRYYTPQYTECILESGEVICTLLTPDEILDKFDINKIESLKIFDKL